jgi:Glycosyl hydrolases family 39
MDANNAIRKRGTVANRLQRLSAVLLATLLLCGTVGMADSNITLTPSQTAIPASYFDLNILFNPRVNVPWPSVPFYAWRFSHVNWPDVEPEKDKWYFDLLDKYVTWGQQQNTEVLMTLTYTPRWASSSPDAPSDFPTPGYAGVPRDMNDWRTFVRTVGTRYKGRIHVYEIWNEPDRPKDWIGTTDQMIEMVRDASQILKQIDPTVTVLSPCPTYGNGMKWMDEFLQKGGGQYVDVIAYHFYTGRGGPPEGMVPLIQQVKDMMQQYGVGNKPLWNTEAGWHEPRPFPSQELAAAYVARAYLLNWAAGVTRFYWYCWDNHDWTSLEMTETDNLTLREGGKAFATIQEWMRGWTMTRCLTSGDHNWICEMKQTGNTSYIVWNTDGDRSFRLSRDWHVSQVTQLDGGTSKIDDDSVRIGVQPVLIR